MLPEICFVELQYLTIYTMIDLHVAHAGVLRHAVNAFSSNWIYLNIYPLFK